MINYSHPLLIALRSVGQNLGILRPTVRIYRKFFGYSYEDGFEKQMMRCISLNDVVWDVGANIGYFTEKFSKKVGGDGLVFAFEPSANTYATLLNNCSRFANVSCRNIGLSNKSGRYSFRDSGLDNDPTNGLVDDGTPGSVVVSVLTGDDLVKKESIPVPDVIKIDVEGFELDVIQGMREVLKNPTLKKIFVEVHFFEMSKRGLKNGSAVLVDIINCSGFLVRWVDPSHFIAIRK